ncbi:MAG TPA: DUF222 domain-containing protein [Actinomycetota bacterium]|jgi:hypothetical protein|nr:DUF222 domain-containing protein [Actinomycetota bacterium]
MEFGPCTKSDRLTDALDRATALMVAASSEALRLVALHDEQKLWERGGATSMTSWLAARYGLAWGTAREWVRVAHALRDLPKIFEAYAQGRLSWDQLRPLTRFANPETDGYWAERAPELRPQTLYREAARHERMQRQNAERVHRMRSLSMWWDPELPVLYLEGMLPAEQGAALQTALERRAEQVVLADQPDSPQEARLADALVELVTGSEGGASPVPTLLVHAGAEILAGHEPAEGPWLSETESGQRLCTDAIRRLACDARIEWVLHSGSRMVGIGRRGRTVPGTIARLLRYRDGGCRFPGCERRQWVKAHHIVHWGDGGGTDLDNLVLLCHAHHRLIHEGGWSISGHPTEDLRFHDPGGRALRAARLSNLERLTA